MKRFNFWKIGIIIILIELFTIYLIQDKQIKDLRKNQAETIQILETIINIEKTLVKQDSAIIHDAGLKVKHITFKKQK